MHHPLARGSVMTAKGQVLNMEELGMKAKRPMTTGVDMKDTVPAKKQPVQLLNVRGFMPSHDGVRSHVASPVVEKKSKKKEDANVSMADLTGIKVDNPKHMRERPEDSNLAANETLRDIMNDLEQYNGRDKPVEGPQTRRAKA